MEPIGVDLELDDAFDDEIEEEQYLTFVISEDTYAIEIGRVSEIIGVPAITELPDMEEYTKGLINLRGSFIPVIDGRIRLKKQSVEYTHKTCCVILRCDECEVGIIVDKVTDVIVIDPEAVIEQPEIKSTYNHQCLRGMLKMSAATFDDEVESDKIVMIVDCYKLLDIEKREESEDAAREDE